MTEIGSTILALSPILAAGVWVAATITSERHIMVWTERFPLEFAKYILEISNEVNPSIGIYGMDQEDARDRFRMTADEAEAVAFKLLKSTRIVGDDQSLTGFLHMVKAADSERQDRNRREREDEVRRERDRGIRKLAELAHPGRTVFPDAAWAAYANLYNAGVRAPETEEVPF